MSNTIPSADCQWHLADRALTPILSTAPIPSPSNPRPSSRQSQQHLQSLTSLTTTAIAAYNAASRLGLGTPQRIIVETRSSGPVILHSYLNPPSQQQPKPQPTIEDASERRILEQTRDDLRPLTATTEGGSEVATLDNMEVMTNGMDGSSGVEEVKQEDDDSTLQRSPLLIASVIAPTLGEAKKAAGVLEQTGKDIQREIQKELLEEEGSQELTSNEEDG